MVKCLYLKELCIEFVWWKEDCENFFNLKLDNTSETGNSSTVFFSRNALMKKLDILKEMVKVTMSPEYYDYDYGYDIL
jgi:hypothetical protein